MEEYFWDPSIPRALTSNAVKEKKNEEKEGKMKFPKKISPEGNA